MLRAGLENRESLARRFVQKENCSILGCAVLIVVIVYEMEEDKVCARDVREEPMRTSLRTR